MTSFSSQSRGCFGMAVVKCLLGTPVPQELGVRQADERFQHDRESPRAIFKWLRGTREGLLLSAISVAVAI